MNKTELVAAVAERTGQSKQVVADVLNGITATIQTEVSEDREVAVQHFGTFKRKHLPAGTAATRRRVLRCGSPSRGRRSSLPPPA